MLDDAQSSHARQLPCGIVSGFVLGFLSLRDRLLAARRTLRVGVILFRVSDGLVGSVYENNFYYYNTSRSGVWNAKSVARTGLGCGRISPALLTRCSQKPAIADLITEGGQGLLVGKPPWMG